MLNANRVSVFLLSLSLSFVGNAPCHPKDDQPQAQVEQPTGLLEVDTIHGVRVNERFTGFNQGRPYAISLNQYLPDARASRMKLAVALKKQSQLDKVVFVWFGKEAPKRLNIMIGKEVPVQIVQEILSAYAVNAKIPIHACLKTEDEGFGNHHRVVIGALIDCGKRQLTAEQLKELLKPGLTPGRLAELTASTD